MSIMQIDILDRQPFVSLEIADCTDEFYPLEFIVDTGFTGPCAFPLGKDWNLLKIFSFSDIELLAEDYWLCLADGHFAKTFSANIFMRLNGEVVQFPVRLFESVDGEKTPLLGMEFLEQFDCDLRLNFFRKKFGMGVGCEF